MLNKPNISLTKQKLIVYIILAAVTLAVYWQVNKFDFVNIDDNVYVTENFNIKSGITLNGIHWAFSTTYAEFWHPLTWLSFLLDYQFYGLHAHGYHVTNLVLHILSALLLFWLFNRMTGAIWKSAFVAAVFALHPLHVESVAWVSERKDVLSAFFWMLTLCLYVYYTEKPVIKRYLLVLCSFVLALMSKPMVITLPVIMILLDYWPLKRFELQKNNMFLWQLKEKLSLIVLSVVFTVITLIAQQKPYEQDASFVLVSRLYNVPVTFVTYLEKTFWPHDLAAIYPFSSQIPGWQAIGALLLIILITIIVIAMAKRMPYLFVGWFWYSITIAPVIGIMQVGNQVMADRYTYLPQIGIAIGLAWGVPLFFPGEKMRKNILFPAMIVFLVIMSSLTWKQCGYWKNSSNLCNQILRATKDNYVAHLNLGSVLFDEGKTEEAIAHYNEVIRIRPNLSLSYNKRGLAYARLGQYQKAFDDLNKVILLKPDYADAYNSRAIIYNNLGQQQQALKDLNKAIFLKPDHAEASNNRGIIYQILGQHQRAVEDFNKAISLKPDNPSIYYNRGTSYINLANYQKAIDDNSKAISLNPDFFDAYNNRAFIYLKLGQYQQAYDDYSKAILIKPDYANAYNNRAFIYLSMGNIESGCTEAKKACELGTCSTLQLAAGKGLCR
jgi:protein O-mannosyl-transferase